MIRHATEADVEEVVAIFEPSFALLDFLPSLHTHEENLAFFARCLREGEGYVLGRGFALLAGDAHGAGAVEFTDGSGNEERTPDVRYEWRPSVNP